MWGTRTKKINKIEKIYYSGQLPKLSRPRTYAPVEVRDHDRRGAAQPRHAVHIGSVPLAQALHQGGHGWGGRGEEGRG